MSPALSDSRATSRRAFSSLGCHELEVPAMQLLARRHDICAIELRAVAGRLDLPTYLADTYGDPANLAAALASSPVSVFALSTSFKLAEPKADEKTQLLAHVGWAEAARIPWLRVFDGGHLGDGESAKTAAKTLAWWSRLRKAQGWNVELMIETHDSLVTASALADFLIQAPDASLLWDTHNTWRKSGEDPVGLWPVIRRNVVHLHVKDSVSRPSARHPFTFVLPGIGEFPMERVRRAIADDYRGLLSLEWERQWHPYLPPLEEALAVAAASGWW